MGKRLSIRGVGSLLKCGSGEEVDGEDCEESVDEVEGDRRHSFKVHGTKFSVDKRYTFVKSLGTGAYGVVCSAMDSVREGAVAIKYIPDVFSNLSDARRILREVRVTQRLTHVNLIQVIDLDTEAAYHEYKDVYMTTELMDTDLRRIIDKEKGLLSEQTKYITYQMLRALQYLHSAHIYHRDVKPANVLVNRSCDIKLADFGLSRYVDPLNDVAKTDYVVTRWYRAPEVILSRKYTSAIDIWSVGCILVEMLSGKVLFKGKDGKDQISLICKTLGKPTAAETAHVTSRNAREFLASLPESEGVSFRELVKHSSSSAMFQAEVNLPRGDLDGLALYTKPRHLTRYRLPVVI
mmetsp:Transcript_27677/g.108539  ORF Transcript_27677/g.108539 Transcript_27677/m.108539 type:complete len:350 (-) Transcript_27677:662-1711(-)